MNRDKIILFGNFGTRNWGNEGTLEATIQNIRDNTDKRSLVCICTDPEDARIRYGIDTYPARVPYTIIFKNTNNIFIKGLRKLILALPISVIHLIKGASIMLSSTTMVVPGTGLLNDFGTGPFGIPYLILKWCFLAKLCGVKVAFLCNGAGPLREKLSKTFIIKALRLADYRSYRSEWDRQFLKELGLDTDRDHVLPDLAFGLKKKVFSKNEKGKTSRVVGLGLMDYYGKYGVAKGNESVYRNYLKTMFNFVEWCLSRGFKVRILIGDSTYDTSVRQEFVETIMEKIDRKYLGNIINEEVKDLEDLLLQINGSEIIVSPRFHNIIFGLMLNKPVLSLSYHDKFESLMESFDIYDYSIDLEELDLKILIDKFELLDRDKAHVIEKAETVKEECREKITGQFHYLFDKGILS